MLRTWVKDSEGIGGLLIIGLTTDNLINLHNGKPALTDMEILRAAGYTGDIPFAVAIIWGENNDELVKTVGQMLPNNTVVELKNRPV